MGRATTAVLLGFLLAACGRRPTAASDPVVGTWDYDIEAGRSQTPRKKDDARPFPILAVFESPLAFDAGGRFWEGLVPDEDSSPDPEGRWDRRDDGSYVVTFSTGSRAGRTMTFRIEAESLVFRNADSRGFHYYSRDPMPRGR
jgi:hypothetical protein